jgi:hypothetical protein
MQRGIRNIRQVVHNSLSRGAARRVEQCANVDEDIYLTRRVFTKVRSNVNSSIYTKL